MRLDTRELGGSDVLAGAGTGRKVCAAFLQAAGAPRSPTICLLDFKGISVATASFLREAVIRFRDAVRPPTGMLFPVIADANDEVREELDELLRERGDAMVCCYLNSQGDPTLPVLLGQLELKQRRAFDLLKRLAQADVSRMIQYDDEHEKVGPTAWNNRLAALAAKGLIIEVPQGRIKLYSPVLKGL